MPAILIGLLPVLVKVAEGLFSGSGKGPEKKSFVIGILESIWDKGLIKLIPDWPSIDEKKLFVETCSLWIDELAKGLK